jgi:hypothetical protein
VERGRAFAVALAVAANESALAAFSVVLFTVSLAMFSRGPLAARSRQEFFSHRAASFA